MIFQIWNIRYDIKSDILNPFFYLIFQIILPEKTKIYFLIFQILFRIKISNLNLYNELIILQEYNIVLFFFPIYIDFIFIYF